MTGPSAFVVRAFLGSAAVVVLAASLLVSTPANAETPANPPQTAGLATTGASPASIPQSTVSRTIQAPASAGPLPAGGPLQTRAPSGFRAGNIISNQVFFDSSTMSAAQIDQFFRSKVTNCRAGYVCLKDYRQNTPNRSADAYCNGYRGGANESAATIIYKVAQSCGLNPQVFIVMLQKEQSLVTHTWPSDWRYTMALGQGCPDTAPCDPAFAGFFYQIYGAGRQMKIYTEGRHFTYYAPGKTWNLLYHPNASCGRSPVYIENAATAALYYYTPYQPNAAALRAGYGEGDACSAYGNRNFYNYFTDWFGSTQGNTQGLVRAEGRHEVYLVSGGTKHYVTNGKDLSALISRLGGARTVSPSLVSSLPTGIAVTRLVRDARNGAVYLLQPGGTKHHFVSVDLIRRYGMNPVDLLPLSPQLADAFPTGPPVGDYFRSEDSGDFYKWENGQRRHIANLLAWQRERANAGNYVAVFPDANVASIPRGRAILAPGTLVKEGSKPEVYIVGNGSDLAHISSMAMSADAGITAYEPVGDGSLDGYSKSALYPIISCGDQTFVLDNGRLTAIADTVHSGTGRPLPESICAVLPRSGRTIGGPTFITSKTAGPVFSLVDGHLHHVQSFPQLLELGGGRVPYLARWSDPTLNAVPRGAPYLEEGTFASFGADEIYVWQGQELRHVTSPQVLVRLAGATRPIVVQRLDPSFLAHYPLGEPIS